MGTNVRPYMMVPLYHKPHYRLAWSRLKHPAGLDNSIPVRATSFSTLYCGFSCVELC
jgi:hypothetical protein